jgi:FHS family L-fucose permease-like MFS transporter
MAMPAGWLASKLGYKGGIIAGLLLVAVGGFWFIPATHINAMVHEGTVSPTMAFVGFLVGVCVIAAGLTFLETIANPYTTVLGPVRFAAARINLAQSCNGVGWILGPIIGSLYFYSKDAGGHNTGSQTLYIPYAGVGIVVVILAVVFFFARVPDIKTEDEYHLDDASPGVSHSIWSHPHFVMAVAAQFFYVAAQAGIFSFFINYMTSETPSIPASWASAMTGFASHSGWLHNWLLGWFETHPSGALSLSDKGASNLASVGSLCFLIGRFTGAGLLRRFAAHKMVGVYALLNALATILISVSWGGSR